MTELSHITRNGSPAEGKPRVYFTSHPDDFAKYFSILSSDVIEAHECAVYFADNMIDPVTDDLLDQFILLKVY